MVPSPYVLQALRTSNVSFIKVRIQIISRSHTCSHANFLSTALVKQAFFSPEYPTSKVVEFEKIMPKYESFLWPNGMMLPFVNFKNVLMRISGWGTGNSERVLVLAGEKDRLVSLDITQREAREYRDALKGLVQAKMLEVTVDGVSEEGLESTGCGVQYRVVEGVGHHFQNDSMWEEGAEKLLRFYQHL
jgi:hypothetical protein